MYKVFAYIENPDGNQHSQTLLAAVSSLPACECFMKSLGDVQVESKKRAGDKLAESLGVIKEGHLYSTAWGKIDALELFYRVQNLTQKAI
jgi:hypothetical protein